MVPLPAEQPIQGELLRPERDLLAVPVPELGLVVEGVAVHGGLVLGVPGLELDGDGVRGLGGDGDLGRVGRPVDDELVVDHVLAVLVVDHAGVLAGVLLDDAGDLEAAVGQLPDAVVGRDGL